MARRSWKRSRDPIACPHCGIEFATKQGFANHQRSNACDAALVDTSSAFYLGGEDVHEDGTQRESYLAARNKVESEAADERWGLADDSSNELDFGSNSGSAFEVDVDDTLSGSDTADTGSDANLSENGANSSENEAKDERATDEDGNIVNFWANDSEHVCKEPPSSRDHMRSSRDVYLAPNYVIMTKIIDMVGRHRGNLAMVNECKSMGREDSWTSTSIRSWTVRHT
ncbi:hypothetical protein THAOC_37061 [Thalassiosira oceanica]|uniref:C2H2-type domain-containing protein n=1 Tax=Thalassiosira oceanica TaxID=159749 RepID=K0R0R4_THAOC|nr:hypothetical protein THAOC_37061 [Thalassiosira oceanica]|eukprot:EJK44399.1 hypothetical protein THAOC_37061 [Thalassiosira oceanica]